jgi:DNA phosphorothioation-associated putative methyltransferase
MGVKADGWDPVHRPTGPKVPADIVNLGYVVNVIEHPTERAQVLREAWELSQQTLIVAARLDWDVKSSQAMAFGDGLITSRGTFQKFFTHEELQEWIQTTLETDVDAAAPGVFYVFRNPSDREGHLSRVVRRTRFTSPRVTPTIAFEQHRDVLEPLLRFLSEQGRIPGPGELPEEETLIHRLGSLSRATKLLGRFTDPAVWERTAAAARSTCVPRTRSLPTAAEVWDVTGFPSL